MQPVNSWNNVLIEKRLVMKEHCGGRRENNIVTLESPYHQRNSQTHSSKRRRLVWASEIVTIKSPMTFPELPLQMFEHLRDIWVNHFGKRKYQKLMGTKRLLLWHCLSKYGRTDFLKHRIFFRILHKTTSPKPESLLMFLHIRALVSLSYGRLPNRS